MPFNMAWFKAQEEKKKAEELAKKRAESQDYNEEKPQVDNEQIVTNGGYYKFHKNENCEKNPHYFLSEEVLVPHANNTDTQRLNRIWSL